MLQGLQTSHLCKAGELVGCIAGQADDLSSMLFQMQCMRP